MKNFFKHKTVLVTGAAGFVGSHLVDSLLELEATVIGVDNFITGRKENLAHLLNNLPDNFAFIEADAIQSPTTYLDKKVKLDVVFHLASPASPPRYQEFPVETYLVNSLGTHHLLDYLQTTSPEARFVYASSSEVYGDPEVHPQVESYWGNVNPNGPRACYDEGKRLGETICGVFGRDFKLDVRIARIFNTYGPRMDPDDGRVMPNFIKQALRDKPITIYGDGSQTRSYCYVSDLVEGLLKLASRSRAKGRTINLGNPTEYTIERTATMVKKATDSKSKFTFQALPDDDPKRRKPDISLAKKVLNWQPEVKFKEGLEKTIAAVTR